jgi:tetratricopeptide (TPR) repeat protein
VRRLNSQALLLAQCVPILGDSRTPAALRALEQAEKAAQAAGKLSLKLGPDHLERGALMVTTALLESFRGHPKEAETLARDALRVLPQGHPDAILANVLLSGSLRAQGRLEEATRIDRELPGTARTAFDRMQQNQQAEGALEFDRMRRIACSNNLKQIGLAFQTWAIDHEDAFPFNVPRAKGGTLELSSAGANGFEQNPASHFLVMSNELLTPKILVCFADSSKAAADNFQDLTVSNISYQIRSGPTIMPNSTNEVLVRCPIHGHQLNCGTLEVRAAKREL